MKEEGVSDNMVDNMVPQKGTKRKKLSKKDKKCGLENGDSELPTGHLRGDYAMGSLRCGSGGKKKACYFTQVNCFLVFLFLSN